MFLILLTYKKPLVDVDRLVPAHMAWLAEHYAAGELLISGRKEPRTGGVIVATAASLADADGIACSDPLVRGDVADYEVIEFIASTTAPALTSLKER